MLCMGWARPARPPFTAGTAGFARRGGGQAGHPGAPMADPVLRHRVALTRTDSASR